MPDYQPVGDIVWFRELIMDYWRIGGCITLTLGYIAFDSRSIGRDTLSN